MRFRILRAACLSNLNKEDFYTSRSFIFSSHHSFFERKHLGRHRDILFPFVFIMNRENETLAFAFFHFQVLCLP